MVKVILWKTHPGDLLGETIKMLTHGSYCHAGFLRGNGQIHEAYIPRVRDRGFVGGEHELVDVFDIATIRVIDGVPTLQKLSEAGAAELERILDVNIQNQTRYNLVDLFRYALSIPFPDQEHSVICSMYVARCLNQIGVYPLARIRIDELSPRDLGISPLLIPSAI